MVRQIVRFIVLSQIATITFSQESFCALGAESNIGVELQALKSTPYCLGEPIVLNIVLKNEGSSPVEFCPDLSQITQSITYYVSQTQKDYRRINLGVVIDVSMQPVTLPAGDVYVHEETLLYDSAEKSGLALPRPGQYWIYARWYCSEIGRIITSNTISLTIVEPQGDSVEVGRIALQPQIVRAFQGLQDEPGAIDKLKTMSRGQSLFAPYAALVLGKRELGGNEFGLSMEESLRKEKERYQRASTYLELADKSGFPLRSQVLFAKGNLAISQERFTDAKQIFETIRRDYPKSVAAQESKALLESIAAKAATSNP